MYASTRFAPAPFSAVAAWHSVPAVSTRSSISTQVLPFDLADDVHHLGLVRARPPLVDDREIGIIESLRQRPCAHHAADIRRHDDQIVVLLLPRIAEQHRRRVHVVDRDIEESLDLIGVQIDRQQPIDAGSSRSCSRTSFAVIGTRVARGRRSWRA